MNNFDDIKQKEMKNASLSIIIEVNKMNAYAILTPPEGGSTLALDEINEGINKAGVVYGIKKEVVHLLSIQPTYNEKICIAQGTSAVDGIDGKIEYTFDVDKLRKPKITEDGKVDFRDLNLIQNVAKGECLCKIKPEIPGISGKTVTGDKVMPLAAKKIKSPKGKNVYYSDDQLMLFAAIDGQADIVDGKVCVFANYEVPANVDNSTGNISFIGNVIIRGSVVSGFEVNAGGSVEVWGVVEGAKITAGGDIVLRRGMQGMDKGMLISEGDIVAKFIERSYVEAKNDIKSEAVMHSNLKCGGKLEVSGRKGLLVGGSYKIGREISAKIIGSPMATFTEIEVGVDPHIREKYKQIRDEIIVVKQDMQKAEQVVKLLMKLNSQGLLSPEKKDIYDKSVRTKIHHQTKINQLNNEKKLLEEKMSEDAGGFVTVMNNIYPGTKVTIGSCTMYVRNMIQYCKLYRDGADVKVAAINKR